MLEERTSRRRLEILKAVTEALEEMNYYELTIEDIAARAGVGKTTIYRWWKNKPDLILETFKENTASIFDLDFSKNLEENLIQQLLKLSQILHCPLGRAVLVAVANHREVAAEFFSDYLLPRREQMHELIQQAILCGEIKKEYSFDLMLDALYAPIHYKIIFFNQFPDEKYIRQLVKLMLDPIRGQTV